MMLVAELVDLVYLNTAKVCNCAMAGVSLRPFPEYESRWISGSAGELFEFSNSQSTVSKDYPTVVETVLQFGARVVYIGSIDDKLVSLESSTFSPASHPHIFRAVFFFWTAASMLPTSWSTWWASFSSCRTSVFKITVIRELSSPLAGNLYGGGGYSPIYEDDAVYDLAMRFALETNSVPGTLLSQRPSPTSSSNPYILPWAVQGVLEEDFVRSDLRDEANELLRLFDD